jgi:hypothetical protein
MDRSEYFKQIGFEKGFEDARKTGGRRSQESIDKYLNAEVRKIPSNQSQEFIEGWHKGYKEGIGEVICKLATDDDFWKNNIYWENPIFKRR